VTERRVKEGGDQRVNYEFVAPRLIGLMPLAASGEHLMSGQIGTVSFRDRSETFGGHLVSAGRRWLAAQLDLLTRAQE
jgi:hypothetical protein